MASYPFNESFFFLFPCVNVTIVAWYHSWHIMLYILVCVGWWTYCSGVHAKAMFCYVYAVGFWWPPLMAYIADQSFNVLHCKRNVLLGIWIKDNSCGRNADLWYKLFLASIHDVGYFFMSNFSNFSQVYRKIH